MGVNVAYLAGVDDKRVWERYAKCNGGDTEAFFVSDEWGKSRQRARTAEEQAAIDVCNTCPVSGNCLWWAMTNTKPKIVGVWGGTTTRERDALSRPGLRVSCVRCKARDNVMADAFQICRKCGLSWRFKKV